MIASLRFRLECQASIRRTIDRY